MTPFERAYTSEEENRRSASELFKFIRNHPEGLGELGLEAGKFTDYELLEACRRFCRESMAGDIYRNDTYQVIVRDDEPESNVGQWPKMIHLSIKRLDREPIHDWRDLQQIKNELVGAEHEAVELYPAESRLTDSANQYHLWVLADKEVRFPFGFQDRLVGDVTFGKAKQRPFAKPGK